MDVFTVLVVLLVLVASLICLIWLAVPFLFYLLKARLDRSVALLERIEHRLEYLERMERRPPDVTSPY